MGHDEIDGTCNQTPQMEVQENQSESGGNNNSGNTAGRSWGWRDLAVGVIAGATAVAAAPLVLGAAGFTAGGVAAGSVAATIQSVGYAGATSGMFSALQSAGVLGLGSTATAAIGGATAGAAVVMRRIGERLYSRGEVSEPGNNQDQDRTPEPDGNPKKEN